MSLFASLERVVGAAHVAPAAHLGGLPVASPADEAEARALIELARADGLRLAPLGCGSKLAWAPPPARVDALLGTRRLAGVVEFVPGDGTLTARCGSTMAELAALVRAEGLELTPDVPRPERATLGGTLAAGASGPDRTRHGAGRLHVLGTRALLASGEVAKSGGRLVKNVTGYDLHRLYCGSFGSLALLLEASLRLFPAPEARRAAGFALDELGAALELARALHAARLPLRALTVTNARDAAWWVHVELVGRAAQLERDLARVAALRAPDEVLHGDDAAARAPRSCATPSPTPRTRASCASPCAAERLAPACGALLFDALHGLAHGAAVLQPAVATLDLALDGADRPTSPRARHARPRRARAAGRARAPARPRRRAARVLRDGARGRAGRAPRRQPRSDARLRHEARPREARALNPAELIDYAKSLDCVHCGLCVPSCPTYRLTGRESASPRGRIHMMRSVAEGTLEPDASFVDELDLCLACRNCESVCPSGVDYLHLLEHTRSGLKDSPARSWLARTMLAVGLEHVLTSRDMLSFSATVLRAAQRSGALKAAGAALGTLGQGLAALPEVPPAAERRPLPETTPAEGVVEGAVATLEGCVMPEMLGRVNRATVRVLAAAGREVRCPSGPTCCGSLHAHNGDLVTARHLARQMIERYDALRDEAWQPLPVVVNSAGCSAHMKDYGRLLADDPEYAERAAAFAARTYDFAEYLAQHALERLAPQLGAPEVAGPITWDDPCHLCHGQGVRAEPRALLDAVDAPRVELADSESCCGSAGLYSALRPADSAAILAPKLEALERSGARTLVTANPGCQMQWAGGVARQGLDVEVLHLAELLARALDAGQSRGASSASSAATAASEPSLRSGHSA
ncbi:MAG: FAD-binding oxidoreductase [Planctomycetes bacterium]|nr:FAD-binding oxidoreductase [Planctomycetota bacterium]